MACFPLNTGYTIQCPKNSIGGLRFIRIALKEDILSIEETASEVTRITMMPGKSFYNYNFPKNTSSFAITPTPNDQNGTLYYAEELKIVMNKISSSTVLIYEALSRNELVIIAEDRNGVSMLLGRGEGMTLSGGVIGSGVSSVDRNGFEAIFAASEAKLSPMSPNYIITQSDSCYFIDRSGSRFVDRTGGGLYILCDDSGGDFALIDFSDDFKTS
jgi:hypothetical protein